jgi:hypothetical protein
MAEQNETWYKWSIWDDKYEISETYEPTFQADVKRHLLRAFDALWMPNEFATILMGRFGIECVKTRTIKIGRRKMYEITNAVIEEMQSRNDYERRNDRERAIQERNNDIIDQLWDMVLGPQAIPSK